MRLQEEQRKVDAEKMEMQRKIEAERAEMNRIGAEVVFYPSITPP